MDRRACRSHKRSVLVPLLLTLACGAPPIEMDGPTGDWPHWGGGLGGLKYSALTQIRAANVDDLDYDSPAPVQADEEGRYPAPIPGAWEEV